MSFLDSDVPTGSDPETVEAFYTWLYRHYLERIPNAPGGSDNVMGGAPQWEIQWLGPLLQAFVTGAILITFFGAFSYFFNHPRRKQGGLYKTSEHGPVPERRGKPPLFGRLAYVSITAWAFYYAVEHTLTGQVY